MEFQNETYEFSATDHLGNYTKTTNVGGGVVSNSGNAWQCAAPPVEMTNRDSSYVDNQTFGNDNDMVCSLNGNTNNIQEQNKYLGNGVPEMRKQVTSEELEHRKPVLRRVLKPILVLMRLFGLYFNDSSGLHNDKLVDSPKRKTNGNLSRKLWKYYVYLVNLIIVLLFLKSVIGKYVISILLSLTIYLLYLYLSFLSDQHLWCFPAISVLGIRETTLLKIKPLLAAMDEACCEFAVDKISRDYKSVFSVKVLMITIFRTLTN